MKKIPYSVPMWTNELMQKTMSCLESYQLNQAVHEKALKARFKEWTDYETKGMFFTPSGTHALEAMALALELDDSHEVILPSFTYAATANAFARTGAKLVFIDIEKDTLNICPQSFEQAITPRSKVVVPIHYGGVAANIDRIQTIAKKANIMVLEDAAHGIGAYFDGVPLGHLGTMGAISFHQSKNITSGGAGGMVMVNDDSLIERVEQVIRQGTNQKDFKEGKTTRYTWQRLGSEFLMSPFHMAALNASISDLMAVSEKRRSQWYRYKEALTPYADKGMLRIAQPTNRCQVNGHIFYMCLANKRMRNKVQAYLLEKGIEALTHYEPLHLSHPGKKYGRVSGKLEITQHVADGLLRLPIHTKLNISEQKYVFQILEDALRTV